MGRRTGLSRRLTIFSVVSLPRSRPEVPAVSEVLQFRRRRQSDLELHAAPATDRKQSVGRDQDFWPALEYSVGSIAPGAALLSATVNDSASDGKLPARTSATYWPIASLMVSPSLA